jgi:hypothetical protein
MTKTAISQYFNPDQHLVLHQDNEGNMIGGGYKVNNLLYQHKMPLFVSLDEAERQSGGNGSSNHENEHFIPEKFSDLFRDLAVPAGLFMMPALFRPRNYAFEVPDMEPKVETNPENEIACDDTDTDTDTDVESDADRRKPVPKDVFDRLLELVTPSQRVQHDVKTRKQHQHNKKKNNTKRARSYME